MCVMKTVFSSTCQLPISAGERASTGLANVMAGILAKKVPIGKGIILAKGKTDRQIQHKKQQKDEHQDDDGENTTKSQSTVQHHELASERDRIAKVQLCCYYINNLILDWNSFN